MAHPKSSKTQTSKGNPPQKASLVAKRALESMDSLVLLADIFLDEAGLRFVRLLKWLAKKDAETPKGIKRYGALWRSLVERQEFVPHPRIGTIFQDYFLEKLLDNDNPFHRKAELATLSDISNSLHRSYIRELEAFQKILKVDWESEFLKKTGFLGKGMAPSLKGGAVPKAGKGAASGGEARRKIKARILSWTKGNSLAAEIADYFYRNGWGLFGWFRAFHWRVDSGGKGQLIGVEAVDPIRLENLVGYDEQRRPLLENIEAFVSGKPANNALLYGERGTGKSSTVKALLNAYQDRGLRLVEVMPEDLKEYHEVLKLLRGRPEKFLLFVDDLSFEENETGYKGLKAILEGTVEATPSNVILIATSNRRHLVREFFDDRAGGLQKDGEIHGADTVEEKLSLSDRFGLVVSFYSPDQDTYLKMVDSWAKFEGIKMPPGELHARALQWEKANNVRSGRTARQFINDLKGKI